VRRDGERAVSLLDPLKPVRVLDERGDCIGKAANIAL
jgi:hypothetical protein